MTLCLLGYKIGISHYYNLLGKLSSKTLCSCGPCVITNISMENSRIQLGYHEINNKINYSKPILGFFSKQNLSIFQYLKECTVSNVNYTIGQLLTVDLFKNEKFLLTKSKPRGLGFSGVIKKYGFKRGPETHGSKHHRLRGSSGSGTTPGSVLVHKRMAGRQNIMQSIITKVKILKYSILKNYIELHGIIPGYLNSLIEFYKYNS